MPGGGLSPERHVAALAPMECDVAAMPMPMNGPGIRRQGRCGGLVKHGLIVEWGVLVAAAAEIVDEGGDVGQLGALDLERATW